MEDRIVTFHDEELNLRGILGKPVAKEVGRDPYQTWQVQRPNVQHIAVEHLYPQHGVFADWETNARDFRPNPDYISDYKKPMYPWQS
jgi:hypothetical protein